jgi:hypothetical protein
MEEWGKLHNELHNSYYGNGIDDELPRHVE